MSDCCARVPAECVICNRHACMTCRRLSTRTFDSTKTGVVCCVECDPADQFKMGRFDETAAKMAHAERFLEQWRDEAPDILGVEGDVPRVVEVLLGEIRRLRWAAGSKPLAEVKAAIEVVESLSVEIVGPPMRGTCPSCDADLDALARTGVTGHICFGPGDSTNHREPS